MPNIGGGLDRKVRDRLICINNECWDSVSKKIRTGLTKDTTDYSTINTAMELLESRSTPEDKKAVLSQLIVGGKMTPQKASEVNELFERELSLCMDTKIQIAIRKGLLPAPSKNDPMMARMNRRIPKK